MRIKNLLLGLCIILFFCYGFIGQPRIIIYPVVTVVSLVQYPFLCMYALFLEPVFDAVAAIKTHAEYQNILQSSYNERSRLLEELIQARAQLVYYKDLYNVGITSEKNMCVARIVYKQLQQPDSFFIIDKGSSDGITVDMVAALNNVLLGRVTVVYNAYSQVMPIRNPQCHVPIVCVESRAHGVYRGNQGSSAGQLDFISHLEPLVEDEMVITSGDGLIYPQGLALGRIKRFALNELGFLYHVDVEPLCDLEKVTYCSIISKNTQLALAQQA